MKKPRFYRWRWLLSLVLGVAVWWGVGWWLGLRPWFEATYPLIVEGMKSEQGQRLKDFEGLDLIPASTTSRLWDRDGRYLYV